MLFKVDDFINQEITIFLTEIGFIFIEKFITINKSKCYDFYNHKRETSLFVQC